MKWKTRILAAAISLAAPCAALCQSGEVSSFPIDLPPDGVVMDVACTASGDWAALVQASQKLLIPLGEGFYLARTGVATERKPQDLDTFSVITGNGILGPFLLSSAICSTSDGKNLAFWGEDLKRSGELYVNGKKTKSYAGVRMFWDIPYLLDNPAKANDLGTSTVDGALCFLAVHKDGFEYFHFGDRIYGKGAGWIGMPEAAAVPVVSTGGPSGLYIIHGKKKYGPYYAVEWQLVSPDGASVAYSVTGAGGIASGIYFNGKKVMNPLPQGTDSQMIANNGHLAIAYKDEKDECCVWCDGITYGPFWKWFPEPNTRPQIFQVTASGKLAFTAMTGWGQGPFLYIDGEKALPFAFHGQNAFFLPNEDLVFIAGVPGEGNRLYVGLRRIPETYTPRDIFPFDNGKRFAYSVGAGSYFIFLVIDGKRLGPFRSSYLDVIVSPDAKYVGFLDKGEVGYFVSDGETRSINYEAIKDIRFAPDGALAFSAKKGDHFYSRILRQGREMPGGVAVECTPENPQGKVLAEAWFADGKVNVIRF